MRLKRWLAAITVGAALAVLPAALPTEAPKVAEAGENWYTPTACWSGAPEHAMWLGVPGTGVWFSWIIPGPGRYSYVVDDTFYQVHKAANAECGPYGLPTTNDAVFNAAGDRIQYFYNPSTPCRLLYMVDWASAGTYGYAVDNGLRGTYTCP